jgi:hypothetical protein
LREDQLGDRESLVLALVRYGLAQFNLMWCNVDFAAGIITVPRAKPGQARHVSMNDTVREILGTLPSRLKSA